MWRFRSMDLCRRCHLLWSRVIVTGGKDASCTTNLFVIKNAIAFNLTVILFATMLLLLCLTQPYRRSLLIFFFFPTDKSFRSWHLMAFSSPHYQLFEAFLLFTADAFRSMFPAHGYLYWLMILFFAEKEQRWHGRRRPFLTGVFFFGQLAFIDRQFCEGCSGRSRYDCYRGGWS